MEIPTQTPNSNPVPNMDAAQGPQNQPKPAPMSEPAAPEFSAPEKSEKLEQENPIPATITPFKPTHMPESSTAIYGVPVPMAVPPRRGANKKLVMIVAAVVLLLLICGGAYYYIAFANTPDKAWSNFTAAQNQMAQSPKFGHLNMDIKYQDDNLNTQFSGAEFKFDANYDNSNASSPKIQNTFGVSVSSNVGSYNLDGIQMIIIGKTIYLDVSKIPVLSTRFPATWIKLDAGNNAELNLPSASMQQDQINKLLAQNQIITGHTFVGTEKINGVDAYHYTINIDKKALANFISSLISDSIQSASLKQSVSQQINNYISQFLDKTNFAQSDLWLNKKDSSFAQMKFDYVMPSLSSLSGSGDHLGSLLRDNQRVKDVQALIAALETFKTSNGGYPAASGGLPLLNNGLNPHAPSPADGSCSKQDNYYTYQQQGSASVSKKDKKTQVYSSYIINFCLGNDIEAYKAGKLIASPNGIVSDTNQPASAPIPATTAKSHFIVGISFNQLSSAPAITAPANAYDATQSLQNGSLLTH